MLILMAVLCSATCGLLIVQATTPASRRLVRRLPLTGARTRRPNLGSLRHRARPSTAQHEAGHGYRSAITQDAQKKEEDTTIARLGQQGERRRPDQQPREQEGQGHEKLIRRGTAVLIGLGCAVLFGGAMGTLLGASAGVAVYRSFSRLSQTAQRNRRTRMIADLPIAVDLLAACLRGGTPWSQAVEAVADAVGGPLGEELRGVAVQIRLGADPASAWLALAEEPTLAPLARTAVRAVQSGAPPAARLARLARDQRRAARTAAISRARVAGIKALAPLGACFLPAFVVLGVVPAVAGMASTILLPW